MGTMELYEKGKLLGKGTFADVYAARRRDTGEQVAIKLVHIAKAEEGIHVTSLRELKLLRELRHPNIISLLDVFTVKKNVAMVLEFMPCDLEKVIQDTTLVLSQADVKGYMLQLLIALEHCHANYVVHRDVKPNNCLITSGGVLKLSDLGLSRNLCSPDRDNARPYTSRVFASWYRAPELYFGATSYSFAVDIWAAGCVMAELLQRRPWFNPIPDTDVEVLSRIFSVLGTPTEDNWPGCSKLPAYVEFTQTQAQALRDIFPNASQDCLSLLAACVSLDPRKRPTASEALKHSWFSSHPLPTPPHRLPRPVTKAMEAPSPSPAPSSTSMGTDSRRPSTEPPDSSMTGDVGGAASSVRPRPAKRSRPSSAGVVAAPGLAQDAPGKFSPPVGPAVRS